MSCVLPVLVGALTAGASMNGQSPAGQVVPPPPKAFVLPAYERVVMKNGLTVLLLEKHDTPLISMSLTLRSGSVYDPAGKEGVAALTSQLLRRGTESRTADKASDELDAMGMQFGSSAGPDSTTVYADFLKKDAAAALPLVADIELHATFPDVEVSRELARAQDEARASRTRPRPRCRRIFGSFCTAAASMDAPQMGMKPRSNRYRALTS
jgi:predicted Zn-dependent peptidase